MDQDQRIPSDDNSFDYGQDDVLNGDLEGGGQDTAGDLVQRGEAEDVAMELNDNDPHHLNNPAPSPSSSSSLVPYNDPRIIYVSPSNEKPCKIPSPLDARMSLVAIYAWKVKHHIPSDATDELIQITKGPWFLPSSLPKSSKTISKLSLLVPAPQIMVHSVSVDQEKVPSGQRSNSTTASFSFRLLDVVVEWVLANEHVREVMHFGLGEYAETRRELWEGALWGGGMHISRSGYPVFGGENNTISLFPSQIISYHPSPSSSSSSAPQRSRSKSRRPSSSGSFGRIITISRDPTTDEVVLFLEPLVAESDPSVVDHLPSPPRNGFGVLRTGTSQMVKIQGGQVRSWLNAGIRREEDKPLREELDGRDWTIEFFSVEERDGSRTILSCHCLPLLPVEEEVERGLVDVPTLTELDPNLSCWDLPPLESRAPLGPRAGSKDRVVAFSPYNDGFNIYSTNRNSVDGAYLAVGNIIIAEQVRLRNRMVASFGKMGTSFEEVASPWVRELVHLERDGFEYGGERWLLGALKFRADMVEVDKLAKVSGLKSLSPCRDDLIGRDRLTETDISRSELLKSRRRQSKAEAARRDAAAAGTQKERDRILQEQGVKGEESFLISNGLYSRVAGTFPIEPSHAIGSGVIAKIFHLVITKLLGKHGKKQLSLAFVGFVFPKVFPSLPNPVSHHLSYTFSQTLHFASVAAFVFASFLDGSCINKNAYRKLHRADPQKYATPSKVVSELLGLLTSAGEVTRIVFSDGLRLEEYEEMDQQCVGLASQMMKLLRPISKKKLEALPNVHGLYHLAYYSFLLSTSRHCDVASDEAKHRGSKQLMRTQNNKDPSLTFMKGEHARQALRTLALGRSKPGEEQKVEQVRVALWKVLQSVPSLRKGTYHDPGAGGEGFMEGDEEEEGAWELMISEQKRAGGLEVCADPERFFDVTRRTPISSSMNASLPRDMNHLRHQPLLARLRQVLSDRFPLLPPAAFHKIQYQPLSHFRTISFDDLEGRSRVTVDVGDWRAFDFEGEGRELVRRFGFVEEIFSLPFEGSVEVFFRVRWLEEAGSQGSKTVLPTVPVYRWSTTKNYPDPVVPFNNLASIRSLHFVPVVWKDALRRRQQQQKRAVAEQFWLNQRLVRTM
ncbi:hypothetical protein BDY24DRAFT_418501 [Mrakia frigida]|uniref:uncharacterized protein n=1 Tax=Mrakia frigida TaxID=29902 RepID=UPI003FCBF966